VSARIAAIAQNVERIVIAKNACISPNRGLDEASNSLAIASRLARVRAFALRNQ